MSWGSALSSAWDAATDVARAAADVVGRTANAAYEAARAIANRVEDMVTYAVNAVASGLIRAAQWAYGKAKQYFGKKPAGSPTQPCPSPPLPVPVPPPAPLPTPPGPPPGPAPAPPAPPPVEDYNIVSIEWLHGDDATTIGDCEQFVNLPRDAKWLADSGIANIDRLSIQPRFIVRFDRPISAGFQWRLVPIAGGTPAYTGTEEGRNTNFVASPKDWTGASSDADGKVIIPSSARLVAGGGYKFQLEAKDHKNKVVKSGIITTKRLFWYVELPMTGLANALASTASVDSEFAGHHMVLKQLPDRSVPMQENIGDNTDSATLSANVDAAIAGNATAAAKAPYLIRITYTNHLAVKNPNQRQRKTGVQVGPGQPAAVLGVAAPGLRPPNTVAARSLWNNLVTGESWFVSAVYTPDGGGAAVPIPADKVTSPDAGASKRRVSVDVTGLPAGTGTVDVFVNVVDRMRAGLALGGAANICVCTIAWWTAQAQDEQAGVVIHEMGHKVQAVPAGRNIEPDRIATQYDNAGHVGSHCHNGAPAGQADYGSGGNQAASTCVMFGSTNGHNSFCGNCAPAMKKVDINAGF